MDKPETTQPTEPQTTEKATPTTSADSQNTVPSTWDQVFQHPRFQRLNEDAKAAKKRADELEKAAEQRTKADEQAEADKLKEQGKLQELLTKQEAAAAKLAAQLAEKDAAIQSYRLQDAFNLEAGKLALAFVDEQAKRDAFALLDKTAIELADDGTVQGMSDALKALNASRGYLFKPAAQSPNIDAASGRGPGATVAQLDAAHQADLKARFRL